jgi:Glycosyltransferase family 17
MSRKSRFILLISLLIATFSISRFLSQQGAIDTVYVVTVSDTIQHVYQNQNIKTASTSSAESVDTNMSSSLYHKCLMGIKWSALVDAIQSKSDALYIEIVKSVIDVSVKFLLLEPITGINAQCIAQPVTINCAAYPTLFTRQRATPVKIAHFIQLGFDVDTLEIHLYEIYDVVDKIFIIESTLSHFKGISKPLIWAILVQTDRFGRFRDKVVHFIIDDVESITKPNRWEGIWALERYTESIRYKRFVIYSLFVYV